MKICAITAEYNPFHNGHLLHIQQTKAAGYDAVVCVLGSCFTQRGEPALFSRSSRVRCTLSAGADLVLSLPVVWSLAAAPDFARGGITVADALGVVDAFSFGSECGDSELLKKTAERLIQTDGKIKLQLEKGISYATAACEMLKADGCGELASLLENPNDLLGVEYIRSAMNAGSQMTPFVVKRIGALHNGLPSDDGIAPASFIRKIIENEEDILVLKKYMPEFAVRELVGEISSKKAPVTSKSIEMAVLSRLRMLTADELSYTPGISEGLENRLYEAIRKSGSLEEIYEKVKTKRYTHARIRRIVMSAAIGLKKSDAKGDVPYIRVLGIGKKGEEILKQAKQKSKLPICARYADISKLDNNAQRIFSLECAADDLWTLGQPSPGVCGGVMSGRIVKSLN